ncbi:MAG: pyruvate formate lyase family protein, partial [Anaerolineae bacterium]
MTDTTPHPISDDVRIAALRDRVLSTKYADALHRLRDTPLVDARSLRASEGEPSWTLRRGLLTRDRLAAMRFEIDDLELLVGRLRPATEGPADVEAARAYLASCTLDFPGQTGHCELDFDPLMRLGLDGLIAQVKAQCDERSAQMSPIDPAVYGSFLSALEGLAALINGAAAAVDAAIPGASPARQRELLILADACRAIAHQPPASFLEAIQLLWFVLIGVMNADRAWLVVPGHLDRTLWPYYQADIARGVLTRERALLLIEHLYIAVNAYIPDGLAMSVMVGGRDAESSDMTNPLSYLCLEALRRTRMIYPTVGVCWHAETPVDLVDLTVDLMGHGFPTPAFFGDATIQ